jgi:hypothetical protein
MSNDRVAFANEDSSVIRDGLGGIAMGVQPGVAVLRPAGRHSFADSAAALEEFVGEWERGTLPKSQWTHGAHVGVAAYFAFAHSREALFQIMKLGIRHYNLSVGTANTEDSGYHETLARFWAESVGAFVREGGFATRLEAVQNAVSRFGNDRKRYELFYSFDVVKDRQARREWVSPDRAPVAE